VRACNVGYAYLKGDKKMGDYIQGFMKKMRDSGELAGLMKQYMTAEQIKATN
jgi:hypothetical protein